MPVQDNRPIVYAEGDSTIIYRASAIGGCLNALWAARNNMERKPIPDVVQKGMDEGTALEPVILELLFDKHGFTFADGGEQAVVELNLGAWNGKTLIVRGKVDEVGCPAEDGVINSMQKHRPIDVKAFTNDDVEKFRTRGFNAFPRYAWQQSVYGIGYGSDSFFMPIFNKGSWQIEDWSLAPHGILFTREQIFERVMKVEEAFESGVMPGECDNNFACQYPYLHEQKPVDTLPAKAIAICRARINLDRQIKDLNDAKKALDTALKELLVTDVAYHLDDYTITMFANPRRFNTDTAKALLTSAEIDWENEPDFWIEGEGMQVRFNPPRKKKDAGTETT